jgi:hypothetical protein
VKPEDHKALPSGIRRFICRHLVISSSRTEIEFAYIGHDEIVTIEQLVTVIKSFIIRFSLHQTFTTAVRKPLCPPHHRANMSVTEWHYSFSPRVKGAF